MIVEDNVLIALSLAKVVEQAGWRNLTSVPNGERAVQAFAQGARPALVILDIHLGRGMDGITAAERIREHDAESR